ncbi:unnamed protein product [Rotaria sordida]|uniref:Uncharacterized protein n=1 Tax=Rotaria sordida TaxID=392033 RepID=A0A820B5X8_9BILA|nr:unnamed protein product [Rotaria sordida]
MINKCTSRKELSFFDHQSTVIRPINVLLDIRQTTLIGSVAKKNWVSVQCSPDQYVVFNVMTPPGLGIHLRQPSLLKYLFHLHGSHIEQTSFFNNHIY